MGRGMDPTNPYAAAAPSVAPASVAAGRGQYERQKALTRSWQARREELTSNTSALKQFLDECLRSGGTGDDGRPPEAFVSLLPNQVVRVGVTPEALRGAVELVDLWLKPHDRARAFDLVLRLAGHPWSQIADVYTILTTNRLQWSVL